MYTFKALPFLAFVARTLAQDFDWDCTNSLGTCNNACFAVQHGSPTSLTYDSNTANRDPRRTAAGCLPNASPCTGGRTPYAAYGNSCDEYPFASTTQGGGATTTILRCVDSTENSSHGAQLNNFYAGVANGHQYNIFVRNYVGATFCTAPQTANDGSEFEYVNGAYQNVKLRRDRRGSNFQDVPLPPVPGALSKFREYIDENGASLLHLSLGYNGTLVGQTVWDNGNWTKIVKEIV